MAVVHNCRCNAPRALYWYVPEHGFATHAAQLCLDLHHESSRHLRARQPFKSTLTG